MSAGERWSDMEGRYRLRDCPQFVEFVARSTAGLRVVRVFTGGEQMRLMAFFLTPQLQREPLPLWEDEIFYFLTKTASMRTEALRERLSLERHRET